MMQQDLLDFGEFPRLGWGDFIEADSNKLALSWLLRWPNWLSRGITIIGESCCGKSHLARLWQDSAKAHLISIDDFSINPRDMFLKNTNFIFDDIKQFFLQHVEKKNENWMFHFLNIMHEYQGYYIIFDRTPAHAWNIELADLKSRLMSLPVISIGEPCDELLKKITQKLIKDVELTVPDNVIDYMLLVTERKARAIVEMIKKLDEISLKEKRAITIPLIRSIVFQSDDPCC